ncbi:MAG TPA: hypothetical protein VNP36_04285 [Burkholderiales bacterium]|nr:hypothetical protein [Burkholderiales bacterium]
MEQRHIVSAFDDFVRGVFAEPSVRASLLRVNRARWLRRLAAQRRAAGAEQWRWEGEGGSTR